MIIELSKLEFNSVTSLDNVIATKGLIFLSDYFSLIFLSGSFSLSHLLISSHVELSTFFSSYTYSVEERAFCFDMTRLSIIETRQFRALLIASFSFYYIGVFVQKRLLLVSNTIFFIKLFFTLLWPYM